MASIATVVPASSTDCSEAPQERRPQAGPLPRKRGEIGYQEAEDGGGEGSNDDDSRNNVLPARHPADRDVEASPTPVDGSAAATGTSPPSVGPPNLVSPPYSGPETVPTNGGASSMRKSSKPAAFLSWLIPRRVLTRKKLGGVSLSTILRLTFQLTLLAGTISLWVVVTKVLAVSHDAPSIDSPTDQPPSSSAGLGGPAAIFVHVLFGIVTLAQLLFLERCVFLVRAQRYAHTHQGASLPLHRSRDGSGPAGVASLAMSLAPWNRPPLPTYAAALAASGVGTGDVEDNLIAIPPPPAYGHTRGSTLLLAGFLRNSLVAAAAPPSSRPVSQSSRLTRSVSYRSHDEDWEERRDAERALRLAEALERLENSESAQPSTASGRTTR